jgi:hypothetical protein
MCNMTGHCARLPAAFNTQYVPASNPFTLSQQRDKVHGVFGYKSVRFTVRTHLTRSLSRLVNIRYNPP